MSSSTIRKQLKSIHFISKLFALSSMLLILTTISTNAQEIPSDLMENCNGWKITYPDGVEDKTLCEEPNNEYFYVNDAADALVFFAPVRSNNGTTPNSKYIRSELREMETDGSTEIYWTTDGSHMMYVKQAITHLPIKKPHLVATQIHGNKDDGIDDSMVLRLENSHLFLSFNGGKLRSNLTVKTDYNLGDIHEVIFLVVNGLHYCYYSEDGNLLTAYNNGTASTYLVKDGDNDYVMDLNYDQTYFKVGNYTQSNADEEEEKTDDPDNYGEVLVYDFEVNHTGEAVDGITLSPSTLSLTEGASEQLTPTISPANAWSKGVTYSSDNTSIATVNSSGLVTAVSLGSATITVTTNDGGFTASNTIVVTEASSGSNLGIGKSITGTGTADGDNVVDNLLDGDPDTRWAVSGFPQSATIDLGTIFSIDGTELICYGDRAYQYIVEISTDGVSFSTVVDRSNNTTPGSNSSPIVDSFSPVIARYVRITVSGAASYEGAWISLEEFRVLGEEIENPTPVTSVSLTPASTSLEIGQTQQLTATVSPSDATNQNVSFTSSNSSVASVNASGLVLAKALGSATITVITDDGAFTSTSQVTVTTTVNSVTSISLTPANTSLEIGQTQQLTATISPSDATNQNVSFTSSDESKATVNKSGLVTAISKGVATITVKTDDGGYSNTSLITILEEGAIDVLASVTEINSVKIYPNPASSVLNIQGIEGFNRLSIYNLMGAMMYSSSDLHQGSTMIEVASFNSGIYLIQLVGNKKVMTKKVKIQ